jgi:alkanesulfonate monooxygenase SsuD/methylene tetrahydromethanopterin reductase-like flavin-dependent oxidoreductase (luciferase family)
LGLGAGWQEREHTSFGYDLLGVKDRFERFREGLEVVRLLTRSSEPVSFTGKYYTLDEAMLMPRSPRMDGPPITIGGAGPKRTMPLVAKYADEWNSVHLAVDVYKERSAMLDRLIEQEGRSPSAVRRSMMGSIFIGATDADVAARLGGRAKTDVLASGQFAGTPSEIVEQLRPYLDAGLDGFKLRILDLDDVSSLELIASEVIPNFR